MGACDTSCPLRGLTGPHSMAFPHCSPGYMDSSPPGGDIQYSTVVPGGFIQAQPSWASLVVLEVKNLPANTGAATHTDSIPRLGRSPGKGNGNPILQYSMDRGTWHAIVRGVANS